MYRARPVASNPTTTRPVKTGTPPSTCEKRTTVAPWVIAPWSARTRTSSPAGSLKPKSARFATRRSIAAFSGATPAVSVGLGSTA